MRFQLVPLRALYFNTQSRAFHFATEDLRRFGSQFLKDIIWQGRNQTMHWEEGHLSSQVRQCFEKLANEINTSFADYQNRNVAVDLIDLLGWVDFAKFRDDMLLLA